MTGLQSYKDFKKEDIFSWADLNFSTLYKIIDARAQDFNKYTTLVTALECVLSYFADKDLQYKSDMEGLDLNIKAMKEDISAEELEMYKWDQKFKNLSSLVGRVNKGMVKVSEFTDHSKLIEDISVKLIQGIGQNIFTTGKTGSGKSESMVKIAKQICENTEVDFDVNTHICTSPQQFTKVYNNEKLTPPGSCLIFDEAGVEYNSRDFYSDSNKMFSKLLQIIRHRSICVIFTAPDLSFIDSQGRKILHWWFETVKLYKNQGICEMKPHVVEIIQSTGKILYPFPVYDDQQLTKIKVRALDGKTRSEYTTLAKDFKDNMAIEAEISFNVNKPKGDDEIQYIKLRDQGLTQKDIMKNKVRMSQSKATRLEKLYKNFKTN